MAVKVDVVSTTEVLWSGEATSVTVPAVDGELGILTGRQPLLAVLRSGEVRVTPTSGEPVALGVRQGFVSVDADVVTVVVDNSEGAAPLAGER